MFNLTFSHVWSFLHFLVKTEFIPFTLKAPFRTCAHDFVNGNFVPFCTHFDCNQLVIMSTFQLKWKCQTGLEFHVDQILVVRLYVSMWTVIESNFEELCACVADHWSHRNRCTFHPIILKKMATPCLFILRMVIMPIHWSTFSSSKLAN